MLHPVKQGLKLCERINYFALFQSVAMLHPVKQGLKPTTISLREAQVGSCYATSSKTRIETN